MNLQGSNLKRLEPFLGINETQIGVKINSNLHKIEQACSK